MMGAEVPAVMVPPIELTDIKFYDQRDQLVLYVITTA